MLVYNKYLKELGLEKKDFPFDRSVRQDDRYKLEKELGVIEAQTWNLDDTIVYELYTYLRAFQENYSNFGIPCPYCDKEDGEKEWYNIIQEIVDGLKSYILAHQLESSNYKDYEECKRQRDLLFDKFDKGWKLLGDNIGCFWW